MYVLLTEVDELVTTATTCLCTNYRHTWINQLIWTFGVGRSTYLIVRFVCNLLRALDVSESAWSCRALIDHGCHCQCYLVYNGQVSACDLLSSLDTLYTQCAIDQYFLTQLHTLMSNTHRRRRRDETVELRRVGGVNTPVGSRDPVYNFLCWQLTSDDIMTALLKKL